MRLLAEWAAIAAIIAILWEAFETVILPRTIQRKLRLTRFFYLFTWTPWRTFSVRVSNPHFRESLLSFYGPLSLVLLFATWGVLLIFAFALLHWGLGSGLKDASGAAVNFGTDLYMSGTTLFTLGLGDITPRTAPARTIAVVESGIGFGMIALVIGYLPALYQAFARREVNISLLAARAGSPPTADQFFRRLQGQSPVAYLSVCEQWAAEILESHVSYPVLCYFRSHHRNQSWLASLVAILDICAEVQTSGAPEDKHQASLTFSLARHALVDVTRVFHKEPALPNSQDADTIYKPYARVLADFLEYRFEMKE